MKVKVNTHKKVYTHCSLQLLFIRSCVISSCGHQPNCRHHCLTQPVVLSNDVPIFQRDVSPPKYLHYRLPKRNKDLGYEMHLAILKDYI